MTRKEAIRLRQEMLDRHEEDDVSFDDRYQNAMDLLDRAIRSLSEDPNESASS